MKRGAPRAPRTGRLVLPPQVVLADLEDAIPSAVGDELLTKVWPLVETEHGPGAWLGDHKLLRLAACLFDYRGHEVYEQLQRARDEDTDEDKDCEGEDLRTIEEGDDFTIDSAWRDPSGPLWKYSELGLSEETLGVVARFHDRGTEGSCRVADPDAGGGYAYTYDADPEEDSWQFQPLVPERTVNVHARTLFIELELTPGGPDECEAPAPGHGPYPDADQAVSRLAEALRPKLQHLPSVLLEDNLSVIAVLITSINAFLTHDSLRRQIKHGRETAIRSDLYLAILASLELGENLETVRRILETHHPTAIHLDLQIPSGGPEETPQKASLLANWNGYLIYKPGSRSSKDEALSPNISPDHNGVTPLSIYTIDSIYREKIIHKTTVTNISPSPSIVPGRSGGELSAIGKNVGTGDSPSPAVGADDIHIPEEKPGSPTSALALPRSWLRVEVSVGLLRKRLSNEHLRAALQHQQQPGVALGIIIREFKTVLGSGLAELQKRSLISLKKKTAEQCVYAARVLEDELPGLYAKALQAIIDAKPLPWLGNYNRLADLSGLAGDLEGQDRERVIELVMSELPMPLVEEAVQHEYPPWKRATLSCRGAIESAGTALIEVADAAHEGKLQTDEAIELVDKHIALAQRLREELLALAPEPADEM